MRRTVARRMSSALLAWSLALFVGSIVLFVPATSGASPHPSQALGTGVGRIAQQADNTQSPRAQEGLARDSFDAQVRVSHSATTPRRLQAKIDWCRGAVWFKYLDYPGLIAEHDYCGGAHRLGRHRVGDRVRVIGAGVPDGIYRVVSRRTVPQGSSFEELRGMGEIVFQTCHESSYRLIGLNSVS